MTNAHDRDTIAITESTDTQTDGEAFHTGAPPRFALEEPENMGYHIIWGSIVDVTNPLSVEQHTIPAAAWTTLLNAVRLDDDPTFSYSAALDVSAQAALWVLVSIDSTLAPTNLRILVQCSEDGGTTWWDFEEGLWASLCWEDVDTAAGIKKAYLLPCGGLDTVRIGAIATGTDANNYFTVTVKARAFTGSFAAAHA